MSKRIPKMAYAHRPGVLNEDPPGVAAARAALGKRRGKPDEADAPPPGTFPGTQPRQIPGQLKLGE